MRKNYADRLKKFTTNKSNTLLTFYNNVDMEDSTDYLIDYGTLLQQSVDKRKSIDFKNTCSYGIKVLDEQIG